MHSFIRYTIKNMCKNVKFNTNTKTFALLKYGNKQKMNIDKKLFKDFFYKKEKTGRLVLFCITSICEEVFFAKVFNNICTKNYIPGRCLQNV